MAVGHHEVLIESPIHDEHPAVSKNSQLIHVINAYADRIYELSSKPYVRYVSVFRNHGVEAGASLSHAHSQIIATPFVPYIPEAESKASRRFWRLNGKCSFCHIIEEELNGPRFITENSKFIVFAPWASIHPLEFWIFPKKHSANLLDLSKMEVKCFAKTLKVCLNALKKLVNDPPYNYGFHLNINKNDSEHYHWHLEVYPKLTVWAGFEKSTGMYINTVTPEIAAENLRKTILN
jgi:UDPglucose--hexose-1-phosphate uridylyltransferase